MLKMRIERAPLKDHENRVILDEYNRLSNARIPMEEFLHWVRDNPAGPAWHAILETQEGRIVGHTSVFPVRTGYRGGEVIPAKSEYSLLHEDFRKEKVAGYENSGKPAFILILDQLFKHCQQLGWGPIFASTNEKNQVFTRKVGLRPLEFPLWECLLVLRPMNASRLTPNLTSWQRMLLFSAGLPQAGIWSLAAPILSSQNGIRHGTIGTNGMRKDDSRLTFFDDTETQRWRYADGQYARFDIDGAGGDYLIVKHGSPDRFLRVCQWQLEATERLPRIVGSLVRAARARRSLGVRWAVYDSDANSTELAHRMKRLGFLCARRTRIVMVHKDEERYLRPALWRMNDSLFTFDP